MHEDVSQNSFSLLHSAGLRCSLVFENKKKLSGLTLSKPKINSALRRKKLKVEHLWITRPRPTSILPTGHSVPLIMQMEMEKNILLLQVVYNIVMKYHLIFYFLNNLHINVLRKCYLKMVAIAANKSHFSIH